ncbi:ABC transporter substrate-binding protein [Chachezhania sediminis]|uniref:ABC transporter substrate-binding protein n=1 Tax=Chachezhania sediminis TaxID=2599291 RepID=UPI00131B3DB5|nr:ABC transporter substrate-binding protein [Chachezhania sediminis]
MKTVTVSAAYIPLVDAAPLIVAEEMGFAEAEGLTLDLVKAPSWSSVRDMLSFGRVDAAHLLSPIPVAMALGLGGVAGGISAVEVLSVNGNVIGVSQALADRLRAGGYGFDFHDPRAAGTALAAAIDGPLRVGVPFPFSMHAELLHYWFEAVGLDAPAPPQIHTIPPPLMAAALGAGEIDAFCVGEPWGSIAVENGFGELLLPGAAIWGFAPEKVLAVRTDWAETEPHLLGRLMRAVWRAGQWLGRPESRTTVAEILSRKQYLDVPAEVIDRALTGTLTISPRGEQRHVDRFIEFHAGAANFPWRSQAAWIAQRIARRSGLDPAAAVTAGKKVFRTDLYRRELKAAGADLPGASEKLEGSIRHVTAVASESGRLFLQPDAFFDDEIFDPPA